MSTAIKVENLSKIYHLGEIGTGTISRDLERWVKMNVLGKEDPFLKIGESNDRSQKGSSDLVYSLQDLNFEIQQGDAVGIIGRNGAGKSTLLKILSRVTTPTTGKINIKGRVASLLEVGTGFHPELTGRENIYLNGAILGMRKREIDRKFDEIVDFSGVERYIDTPVKRYSSGMYVRLAFAVAAHLESEILIVDEVLAVGDAEFQKKCLGKMGEVSKGEGRTVLFVSHNMAAVQSLCGKGIYLIDGEIKVNSSIYDALDSYLLSSNKVTGYYANSSIESNKKNYFSFIEINNENGEITNTIFFSNSIKIRYGCIISDVTRDSQIIISMVDKYNSTVFSVQKDLGLYTEGEIIGEMTIPKSIISPGLYIFKIDANYTEELFEQLGKHILNEAKLNHETMEQTVVRAMNTTYSLQKETKKNLFQYSPQSFKAKHMRSSELDLLDVSGACGSASLVLARIYMAMGYPTRIGQMYANGHFGGHMLVEVWSNGRWMVMDPLFNQVFYNPDSSLASFNEVQNNFATYAKQLLPEYPKEYRYQDVRYTNWDKIPVISPLFKKTLNLIYGEQRVNQFCLRKYIIKFYLLWFYIFLSLFIFSAGMSVIQWRISKKLKFDI